MNRLEPLQLMRIHIGEDDRYGPQPLYEEIVTRCRAAGIGLVSVYRGIEGYGASTIVHRPGLFGRSKDAPIVVTIVDTEARVQSLLPVLNGIVDEGLVAISRAQGRRTGAPEVHAS